jgi:hypothetical protein
MGSLTIAHRFSAKALGYCQRIETANLKQKLPKKCKL